MGLIDPVELPEPGSLGPVHFIAIGGSGMNGIAVVFVQLGTRGERQRPAGLGVPAGTGGARCPACMSDIAPSSWAHARTVVASSAIREDNPELAEARRRGLRVLHRSAAWLADAGSARDRGGRHPRQDHDHGDARSRC